MMKVRGAALSALLCWGLSAGGAIAEPLVMAKVVSGYSNCSLKDNGDGTSTASLTLDFNQSTGNTNNKALISRGIIVNTYNRHGIPQGTPPLFAIMDGHPGEHVENRPDNVLVHGELDAWGNELAQRTHVAVKFRNASVTGWPAVFIRAANYVEGFTDVAEISGGAYITAAANGSCRLITDPASPPPFDINITVNAPDWDLGEINPGPQTLPLRASSDRLCLEYRDNDVDAKPFIINATNQNGMADGRFQLKNTEESSQLIPYELILENGSQQVPLPNNLSAPIPLDRGGKTCFSPLFHTFAAKNIHPGDYTDVLTFTIVTPT